LFIAGGSVTLINDTLTGNDARAGLAGASGAGGAGGAAGLGGAGGNGGAPGGSAGVAGANGSPGGTGASGPAGSAGSATGGGLYVGGGSVSLVNATIAANSVASGGSGGGLDVNAGTAALDNTLVALNTRGTGRGAPADDIAGTVDPASAFNLIGKGGAGGLTNGVNRNQVGVANPLLGTLADNSGPTPTLALLPGSRAIGKGSAAIPGVTIPTTDQRGVARPTKSVDIGAFQDRGFTLTIVPGDGTQSTVINTPFSNPLAVIVSSPYGDPVQGGAISYTVKPSSGGASASRSAHAGIIGAGGLASVTATANGTVGSYTVKASAYGVATPAVFALTNLASVTAAAGIHRLSVGRHTDLPWLGITQSQITRGAAATRTAGDLKLTIGNAAIATFTRRLDVLTGDFTGKRVVNSPDVAGVGNEIKEIIPLTLFGDINGDGKVDLNDWNAVRARRGTTLPPILEVSSQ
jgi:hypothetical protein